MTKNECREVEVPVCTKEPATVPKEVCKEIPREVRIPNDLSDSEGGDKDLFENVFFQVCLEEVLPTCAPVKKQECRNVCQDVCKDIYWCKVCA